MNNYLQENWDKQNQDELRHLEKTIDFMERQLMATVEEALEHRKDLIEARKDMVENTTPFSSDFERLTEMVQSLSEVNSQTIGYTNMAQYVARYKKLIDSPYFGRFDFIEDSFGQKEAIYIGLANVINLKTRDVYVYDWRAPISSIFYRYELGRAQYDTPDGVSSGDVLLKRQYKIQNSKLKYFFDCSIRITDDILQEILGRNSSPQMRNIVETIQKEQDQIIRDTDHELLIVQGCAGSGKTSIALHRIAFLLYENLHKIRSDNIIIISPNDVFSQYISSVLPELGEENVIQATFDDLASASLGQRFSLTTREEYLEGLIHSDNTETGKIKRAKALFKGSQAFLEILDRWIRYYGHRLIPFEDVYFNGILLETRQELKNRFLRNEIEIPMAKQLQRIESMLLPKTHPFKKERLERLQGIVARSEGRDLEILPFSRLLSIKESEAFRRKLQRFTSVDYFEIYQKLFSDPGYILKMAKGLELPTEIKEIIALTTAQLQNGGLDYDDYAPLLYLKLRIEGAGQDSDIKHVVIDEAQDYTPLQYELFKHLFRHATFTVLGDINQAIDQNIDDSLYNDISAILAKKSCTALFLKQSYRSTWEINQFTSKLLDRDTPVLPFERHGSEPQIVYQETRSALEDVIVQAIAGYKEQGYATVAVICKTQEQAESVYLLLKEKLLVSLIRPHDKDFRKGPLVVSAYMAKGLEFDAVIVYDVSREQYATELDRKLLYISCTRAQHELALTYTGELSPLL